MEKRPPETGFWGGYVSGWRNEERDWIKQVGIEWGKCVGLSIRLTKEGSTWRAGNVRRIGQRESGID